MSDSMTPEELANLSDEEFLNMAEPDAPAPAPEEGEAGGEEELTEGPDAEAAAPGSDASPDGVDDDPADPAEEGEAAPDDQTAEAPDAPVEGAPAEGDDKNATPEGKEPDAGEGDAEEVAPEPINFEEGYKKIMAPFKAAGKMIEPKSPEDVVQLMQMGAHYTKKMQALQPNLKLLRMLENNDLLDEGKLSYLIDVNRKDPKAIQKLVKESGLDPLEIDTSEQPDYRPGNYSVSDSEFEFTSILEDVGSDPEGKTLIVDINNSWDAQSKEALWTDPNILRVMHEQKNLGIYDQISSEVDRRKTLGYLRNEPFLQSYQAVGKEMQAKGLLTPKSPVNAAPAPSGGQPQPQERRVVETRPAAKKTVSNSERAKAASPAKATPTKSAAAFNPLALSDEEFEKNAQLAQRI